MDKAAFRDEQSRIYGKFQSARATALTDGLRADPVVTEQRGGVLVAFRYGWVTVTPLTNLALRIRGFVPATIAYGPSNAHTSIMVVGEGVGKIPDREEARRLVLDVRQGVEVCSPLMTRDCKVYFDRCLMSQTTIITPGDPNGACLEVMESVLTALKQAGVQGKEARGTSLTVARFGTAHSPQTAREVGELLERTAPIGGAVCKAVEVAIYTCNADDFRYDTIARFELSGLHF